MFSKELRELDRNTVQFMIDGMQEELDSQAKELNRKDEVIENGIRALIESYREMGACRKKAAERAASAYAMSAEEADQYVEKYWKD